LKHQRYNDSTAKLKDIMTALPMSAEIHAARMRKQVEARRAVEDAKEAVKQQQDELTAI
jgi:hypothetical protein